MTRSGAEWPPSLREVSCTSPRRCTPFAVIRALVVRANVVQPFAHGHTGHTRPAQGDGKGCRAGTWFQAYKRKQDGAAVPPASSAWAGAQVPAEPVKQYLHRDPAFGATPFPQELFQKSENTSISFYGSLAGLVNFSSFYQIPDLPPSVGWGPARMFDPYNDIGECEERSVFNPAQKTGYGGCTVW